jgi:peroxiredoxin
MHIPFELLSDARFEFTRAMALPTFDFRGRRYIRRLTLIVADGSVEKVHYPVFPPGEDAERVLEHLRGR